MGRKYYHSKKRYRSSGSGGLASLLFSALSGRRRHHARAYYAPRPSLKQTLLRAILKRVFRKFL